jgi:hypothetical protein
MGHIVFLLLHFIALLFGAVALFVTIPLHLIYAATRSRKVDPAAPSGRTHTHCPDCREFVLRDAIVCKHCGRALTPSPRATGIKAFFTNELD